MRNRSLEVQKARHLGEVQVALGFSGFFTVMYGLSGLVILLSGAAPRSDVLIAVLLTLFMSLLPGWTFTGLFRGRPWGWVLGIVTFGLLLLGCLACFAIALVSQLLGEEGSGFAESTVALFGSLIFSFLVGTPLYLLIRCRRKYFEIVPKR